MQELEEIWGLVLEDLRKKHSNTVISLWIKDLRLVMLNETKSVLYIESPFKKNILEKKYIEFVAKSFENVIGYKIDIEFTNNINYSEEKAKSDASMASIKEELTDGEEQNTFLITPEKKKKSFSSDNNSYSAEHTFENFIVGSSNKFAYAACTAVAEKPGHQYNPLFIYGPSGLGKTHLLYAITNEIHKNYPDYTIIYVKGDEFTNQMIESISRGLTSEFREKYRKADVLLIDDVHFIAGKEATQEEFFHTFNDLYEHGKHIILTSDRPPKDIQHLEDRLKTRFEWGLSVDIQPPDFELRMAIMQNKATALGTPLSNEVLSFLAENLTNNIRQIEGAIKKIIARKLLNGDEITISLVMECVSDLLSNNGQKKVTPDTIISKVAASYNIEISDIKSEKRASNISNARHICIYLIKKISELSYPAIGKILHRDHTTIMASYKRIEKEIKNNSAFEIEINELIKEINS